MPTETAPGLDSTPIAIQETKEIEPIPDSPIQLLLNRKARGYRPGIDDDGHKIGLAFDAGGYAGVVSLAMAMELRDMGLLDYVDAFYGLSAGGINAAYVAAGQIEKGLETYTELMPGRFDRLPLVNLGVVADAIYDDKPLKMDELKQNSRPVVIGATQIEGRIPVMIKSNQNPPATLEPSFDSKLKSRVTEQFMEWLIAGSHLPRIAGVPPESTSGLHYTDGTIGWQSPIEVAQVDGCTEIISLANMLPKKKGEKSKNGLSLAEKASVILSDGFMNEYNGQIRLLFADHQDSYRSLLLRKQGLPFNETSFDFNGSHVQRIFPTETEGLPSLLTGDIKKLAIGIEAGKEAVKQALIVALG